MRHAAMDVRHRSHWAPISQAGRWALALAGAAVTGVALSAIGFATGLVEAASSFSDNWLLTGWGLMILATGAASAVAGAIAVFRDHDRSWGVLLATAFGAFVVVILLNEVAQGL